MLRALDFTSQNVEARVLERITNAMKDQDIKEVDFTGTVILEKTHEKIAEAIIFKGLTPRNIIDSEDRDKIEYYRMKLYQPQVESIDEFVSVFKKRFKKGKPCILDRTIAKGLKSNENKKNIIMIEGYDKHNVYIRMYYSSKVQPKFFDMYGGKDAPELFMRTQISFVDLYKNDMIIEHPRDERERAVIRELFEKDYE